MRRVNIRFYSLHIRSESEIVNYVEFFEAVGGAQGSEVQVSADYTTVLDKFEIENRIVEMVFLGGDTTAQTVYYDRSEGGAVVESSSNRRWAAKPTRVVVDLTDDNRIVALESIRGGVTPTLFERYLERVEVTGFPNRSVDVPPLAAESFIDEIDDFERIRLASVEVARPNIDWSDHANNLYELADESGAQSSTAKVKAPRGESLNKHGGLIGVIREVVTSGNSSIKNATITGRKPGDVKDRQVSLTNHHEKSSAEIDQTTSLSEQNDSLLDSLKGLAATIRSRRRDAEE